jgi:peptidoglycan-N-acetylmuramic acid deacetylase
MKITKLKRNSILLLAILLALPIITMPTPVYAVSENTAYNWYVKRNNNHTLPQKEPQFNFINDYNAYYGDTKAAENGDKVIYLTFDAGYENGNIERILDTLKKHNAPAAFFVLKNLVERNTVLVKRMHDDGHLVCNHTMTHPDMTKLTDNARFD